MRQRLARAARAIVLPPDLARDRIAVFVDQAAHAVGAPGSPENVAQIIENLESQESAAEADARGELVADKILHGNGRLKSAFVMRDVRDLDRRGGVCGLVDDLGGGVVERRHCHGAHHHVLGTDPHHVGELLAHHHQEQVESDEIVACKTFAHGHVDGVRPGDERGFARR